MIDSMSPNSAISALAVFSPIRRPRDIVGRVADQRLVIGDVLGSKTIAGMDRGRIEVAQISEALRARQNDCRVLVDELQQIAVAGDDDHPQIATVAAGSGRDCR